MAILVCHTEGCPNEGVEIELDLTFTDENGDEQTVSGVTCGGCSQPISDIQEAAASTAADSASEGSST